MDDLPQVLREAILSAASLAQPPEGGKDGCSRSHWLAALRKENQMDQVHIM